MNELFCEALAVRFDPKTKEKAYSDDNEHIRDIMSLVSLCLVSAVACKSACAENSGADEPSNIPSSAMSAEEAECYVGDYPASVMESSEELQELHAYAYAHINFRVEATRREGTVPRLVRLCELFKLSDFTFFCLCCALSSALDRGFERLFEVLHGNAELQMPTLGAVQACYALIHPYGQTQWQSLLCPSSPENVLVFTAPVSAQPLLLRPLELRASVLSYILHQPYRSRELASCSTVISGGGESCELLFADEQLAAARCAAREMNRGDEARICVLCGAAGSGKKLTLAKLAAEENLRFLLVRMDGLSGYDVTDELVLASLLEGYILCFSSPDDIHNPALTHVLTALGEYRISAFLLATRLRSNVAADGYIVMRIDYPTPDLSQSLRLWQSFLTEYEADASIDAARLASKYVLTPGQIKSALRTAASMARAQNTAIDAAHIDNAVLLGNTGNLSKIADKINVFYAWDDLVLGDTPKGMLRDVCSRIKHRHLVEIQWGFGGKSAYGNGISILLYGPPGTGKTMSAQVIAGELGLPLYRINLAQIISKYIGETAKNLDNVFGEAKSSNVILFFDEADALFAKRTDVKNSNDRHANSESSYLLQKIEEYSGISILATNLANNFDEAFRRRINYMIHINMPSPSQRLELWRGAIPKQAPLSPDLDLQTVADNLDFSGSVIKSAALQAAYFAADENAQIGMAHIAKAARRELQKLGKSEPHFLSMYPEKESD